MIWRDKLSQTPLRIYFGTFALVMCGMAAGCSVPSRSMDEATLLRRVEEHQDRALEQRSRIAGRWFDRIERLHASNVANGSSEPVEINVLLLSSGGQYGAFGAGVLDGWRAASTSGYEFPKFDIVTGVSTGALIAPFAVAGTDNSIQRISDLFKQADDSFATLRGVFFFLPWRTSMFDTRVLRERIQSEIDIDMISQTVDAHEDSRSLLIGAVDLDLGRFHIWDMGPIAVNAIRTEDLSAYHNAMISSASIPGAFPPIEIDGVLYTDGAAALATFMGLDRAALRQVIREFLARNPNAQTPRLRMWMIVNSHIDPTAQLPDQRWTAVAVRSASVLASYSLRTTLRLMQLGAELVGHDIGVPVEFRYICVPQNVDLPEPTSRLFDQNLMIELHELGRRLGADPTSWRTEAIGPDIPGSFISPGDIRFEPSPERP